MPTAPRTPQDESLVTYSPKLGREDGEIDWSRPAAEIARFVRAYEPWPGTTTLFPTEKGPAKLKLFPPVTLTDPPTDLARDPGSVTAADGALLVRAGDGGVLRFSGELQLEGRKRLSVAEFLRGQSLPPLFLSKAVAAERLKIALRG